MRKHEFVVENKKDANDSSYLTFSWDSDGELFRKDLSEEDHVFFDDDFIVYLNDSLDWIPSWNPSTKIGCKGLNIYGVTTIDGQNLIILRGIIQAWTDMFGFAPENIVLKGSYFTIGGIDQSGQYERLEYKKTDLIKKLKKLIKLIDKALAEDKCILHLGI